MRVCIVYDCVYPWTVGGAERWYRNLAERLAADGHHVTFLTMRQWPRGVSAGLDGVDVRAVAPPMRLYTKSGRRRLLPPLVFAMGVLVHLVTRRRAYEVVHTASFPFFPVLAARSARASLVVDWHECWSPEGWKEYVGGPAAWCGRLVQRLCVRTPHHPICFAQVTARRLRDQGVGRAPTVLRGQRRDDGHPPSRRPATDPPTVVFAGRHIADKRVGALVPAFLIARRRVTDLQMVVFGDGPCRGVVEEAVRAAAIEDLVSVRGFAPFAAVEAAMASAVCVLQPSRREGYGAIVVEAAAVGCPTVLVAGPDNAATELVSDLNGAIAPSPDPTPLGETMARVIRAGPALRDTTAAWFDANRDELSFEASYASIRQLYGRALLGPGGQGGDQADGAHP